jgi:hypothetical protein
LNRDSGQGAKDDSESSAPSRLRPAALAAEQAFRPRVEGTDVEAGRGAGIVAVVVVVAAAAASPPALRRPAAVRDRHRDEPEP